MRPTFFTIILIIALLTASFIGIIAYYTFAPSTPANEQISPPARGGDSGEVGAPSRPTITSTDPLRGNPRAPLTIVEFGDFQCAACATVEETLLRALDQYQGKVKLVWKDLPNLRLHPIAQRAAQAARCADEHGRFWEYHDRLLANQAALSETSLIQFARELGLNMDAFTECLESGRFADTVTRSLNEAILLRVDATPYFFIGERRISGAVSEEELRNIIEQSPKL